MINIQAGEKIFRSHPCARKALWSLKSFIALEDAKSFSHLVPIAVGILECFEEPVTIVSGPISTGGLGTREHNMAVFRAVIQRLQSQNRSVFDQTPFENVLFRISREWFSQNPMETYCMPILEDFYEPIFSSGLISRIAFIRGWQSSFGARWERMKAIEIGLEIDDLPHIEP